MKITLICNARLPSERAHPLQVMHMWKGFSKLSPSCLLYPFRFQRSGDLKQYQNDFWRYYGYEKAWSEHHRLPTLDLVHLLDFFPSFVKIYSRIQQLSFAFSVGLWFLPKKRRQTYVWSREILSLPILHFLYPHLPLFYEMHRFPGSLVQRQLKWLNYACGVICLTEKMRDQLVESGYPQERILVAHDAYDDSRFSQFINQKQAREKLSLPSQDQMVVYTGHLYPWKGVDTLVQSMQHCPTIKCYIVGGMSEDVSSIKERIKPWPENVHLVGHKKYEEIPYWLAAADVVVIPNSDINRQSRYYTSPLKLYEALMSRSPVIVSDLPSLREVVDERHVTFFIPNHVEQLAQEIKKICQQPGNVKNKIEEAVNHIKDKTWNKRASQIVQFMNQCLEKK